MPGDHKRPIVKRKRAKEEDSSSRISGKLHHYAREVKKAAKKAKDFEIRKLVKRLKGLRAKETVPPELKDLEEQLVLLKEIDHEIIANTALKTKLKKDKKLSENSALEEAIAKELAQLVTPATPGSNLAKVQGRLLSSKVVATEVHTVVEEIRIVVFPELKKKTAAEEVEADSSDDEDDEDVPEPPAKKARLARATDDAENATEASSEEGGSLGEEVVLDEDDEAVDDGGWESGSVGGEPDTSGDEGEVSEDEGSEEQDSDDESDEDQKDPPDRNAKAASSKATTSKASSKAGESTFLPSLSVGFTRGDSDASDIDDGEVAKADARKNRRGQRARRAIWEKKYGKNANHVKKQVAEGAKDARQPFKRPVGKAQGSARFRPQPQGRPQGRPSQQSETPMHPSVPMRPPARKVEDKPLHPSWEAKRKLKEKQGGGIVPPQGKKIVF